MTMKKRLFYGFALFITLFMLFIWQIAAAELADIQTERRSAIQEKTSQYV
jgi:hypothetical protein